LTGKLNNYGSRYRNAYGGRLAQDGQRYRGFFNQEAYRYYYSGWFRHGFYGGFFYPVFPCLNIYNFFWFPLIYWMFTPDWDESYWTDYAPQWDSTTSYPTEPFTYAGVIYPTDTLRDLGIELSAMDSQTQANFRQALTVALNQLQDQVSSQLTDPIKLSRNEVVINHYQNLKNAAIVIEGFVSHGDAQYAFKALLDLVNPTQTLVFVPPAQNPADTEDPTLKAINDRIVQLGGDPYTADQEPTP
jgi:hypothetical protein